MFTYLSACSAFEPFSALLPGLIQGFNKGAKAIHA